MGHHVASYRHFTFESKLLWPLIIDTLNVKAPLILDLFNLIICLSWFKITNHFKILPHEAVQVVRVLSIQLQTENTQPLHDNIKNCWFVLPLAQQKSLRWTHVFINVLLPVLLFWFHNCGCILHGEAPNLFLFSFCYNPVKPQPTNSLIFADLTHSFPSYACLIG